MEHPILSKKLLNSELLVFFDLEATQIRHKAIAFAMICMKREKGTLLFTDDKPLTYFTYIKTNEEIGPVVEELTGIKKETLDEKGIEFHQAVLEITKILRPYKYKKFLSYGSMDIEILLKTISEDETEKNFVTNVIKNYLDLHNYFSKRIVSEKGASYSLKNLADKYNISEEGILHNPLYDSYLLKDIYESYIKNEDKTMELALENYTVNRYVDEINKELAASIIINGHADKSELVKKLEEYL